MCIRDRYLSVQLVHYLDLHSLMPPFQSGFRKFHSTESLMVSLLADYFMPLIMAMSLYFPSMTLVPLSTLLITPSFLTGSLTHLGLLILLFSGSAHFFLICLLYTS